MDIFWNFSMKEDIFFYYYAKAQTRRRNGEVAVGISSTNTK